MPQASKETISVAGEQAGQRLDRVLAQAFKDQAAALSRTRLKALILDGAVSIGARTIRDPGYRVNLGETVTVAVPAPEPAEPGGESIPLDIVFEDDAIIVIDKPAGLVVHPAAGHATGTLVNALIAHCGDSLSGIGGVKRPGIVHRLDKDTTGLMVVAKTDRAHQALAAQFADHGRTGPLRRGYLAFVWGAPARPKGTIDEPIDRHPKSRDRMAVRANGRIAITHWQVLERFPGKDGKAGGEPDRVPAGDRPHPPDPRPPGAYRPSAAGRRHLRHRLQDQGDPAAAGGAGGARGPWTAGPACLSAGHRTPDDREKAGVPIGTPGPLVRLHHSLSAG